MLQVSTIQTIFERNLKDLYLLYLKSPKHVDFSLCRFWDHLNYNEYYSNIFNRDTNYLCLWDYIQIYQQFADECVNMMRWFQLESRQAITGYLYLRYCYLGGKRRISELMQFQYHGQSYGILHFGRRQNPITSLTYNLDATFLGFCHFEGSVMACGI